MILDLDCEKFLKRLGARLKDIRKEKGWTLEQTEEHGWSSWRHLQKIENVKNVTLATLWKLSKVYKVPINVFFENL